MVLSKFPLSPSCTVGIFDHSHFYVELHLVRTLFDPFQYESIYFLLVLHHDLKQIHFFFTNFEIVSTQFASKRAFRWGSGRRRLNAVPNWQCVLLQQVLSIAFRGEKNCMEVMSCTSSTCSRDSDKLSNDSRHSSQTV